MVQFNIKQNSNCFFYKKTSTQKIIWASFRDPPNIREKCEDKFVLYIDNDVKHVSVENLKWYSNCEIEIETGPPHSLDIKPIENVWEIIKKKLKNMNSKVLMSLNHVWRLFFEVLISAIQNWVIVSETATKEYLKLIGSI